MRHWKTGLILAVAAILTSLFTALLTFPAAAGFKPLDVVAVSFACHTEQAAREIAAADKSSRQEGYAVARFQILSETCGYSQNGPVGVQLQDLLWSYVDAEAVPTEVWRAVVGELTIYVIVIDLRPGA